MAYSLRKRGRKSKITKRRYNKTRRFKKSRKQYGGTSDVFTTQIESLLNQFNFTELEKNKLLKKFTLTRGRYEEFPSRKDTLIEKLNLAINATDSTLDEKKVFVYKLFDFWMRPEIYRG